MAQTGPRPLVVWLEIDGAIGPASSDYLVRAVARADEEDAEVIVLQLDTPGGLDSAMREIIQAIVASPVPVVTYVAPSGARAASAGTYILYASHVAAMAPGTNLGAATPVAIGGGKSPLPVPGRPGDEATPDEDKAEPSATTADKAVSDAAAYLRSLAQMRGRNAEWAEQAVRTAASLAASEALALNVIDLIAEDGDDLLAQLDGRAVSVGGVERPLRTTNARILSLQPDWRTRLLSIITNPNIAYILLLIGIYGLLFEFYSPGLVGPGIVGAICLLLALYAFQLLPVNYAGLALIALGLALMVSEAFVPSFGALGIGGAAAFVIGSVMLLETDVPGFTVSWLLIGSVAGVSAGLFAVVVVLLVRSRRRAVTTGPEELVGSVGEVVDWSGHQGRIRVHGELWQARAQRALQPGRQVTVSKIDGLVLVVHPVAKRRDTQ